MGREKIEIKKINNLAARQVTFSKRRQGLVKKARELSILCEADVAVIVVSQTGRIYHYSNSNIEEILKQFSVHLESERKLVQKQVQLDTDVEDEINSLSKIIENLHKFGEEEANKLEMNLEEMLTRLKNIKRVLHMNEVSALQSKDPCTHSGVRSQAGELAASSITEFNSGGPYFPYHQLQNAVLSEKPDYPPIWTLPPPNTYKVNFSGTNFGSSGVGVGVVIRNWKGEFMAALAKFSPELMDFNNTCFFAAKCALEFAAGYYFTDVVLEGDSPSTINRLKTIHENLFPVSATTMLDAKMWMMQFSKCMFKHIQATGNIAAYVMAQYAKNVSDEDVWLIKEPDFLVDILFADRKLDALSTRDRFL